MKRKSISKHVDIADTSEMGKAQRNVRKPYVLMQMAQIVKNRKNRKKVMKVGWKLTCPIFYCSTVFLQIYLHC